MRSLVVAIIVGLLMLPTGIQAQAVEPLATSTPAQTTELATETPIDQTAFTLPAPTGWEFFKRRFVHFFTFGEVKRLRQELELANLTLIAAQEAEASNETAQAATLVDRFMTEMERISGRVGDLAADLATRTDDAQVQSLLEQIQVDRILQASATEQLAATTQAELQAKALAARASALRDLAKLMTADDPTPAKFQERLTKIAKKLAERETKLERKIAKRLAALEALDEEIEDPELEDAIEHEEANELDDIAALDTDRLGTVVRAIEGSLAKHLLVLQALLEKVPDASRDTVESVVREGVERLKQNLEADQAALEDLFDEDHESPFQEKLLERLKKETGKASENLKDAVEKQQEQTQKAVERERERAKKATELEESNDDADEAESTDESKEEDGDDATEDDDDQPASGAGSGGSTPSGSGSTSQPSSGSGSGTGSSGSSGSGGSTGSGSNDDSDDGGQTVKTESKTIEVEDLQFKTTSIEVEKGTQLTVTLKNKDSVAHTFSIVGASTSTGTVSAGGEKSVTFTVDKDLEFYCALHASMTHGTIRVKN